MKQDTSVHVVWFSLQKQNETWVTELERSARK